jgi:CRISPR-associated endonuclease/helicase Cas3
METMGLSNDEVIQLHSKAGFQSKEENQDGIYGNQKLNYLDNLFVNYPFCLLSHIKFFDLLKTHEKESNYLLHRLANSVVVIDELQSYNPSHWDKVIYFVKTYAHFFNIKFILMSATLPKLDKLHIIQSEVQDFVYLLPNAKTDYFQNPNFAQRVNFRFDLLNGKEIDLENLAKTLLEKSEDYSQKDYGKAKPKNSVYTIIEFIFKKSATEFYQVIKKQKTFFDEIFVLSGTILEHRRKYIIDFLKNPENRKKRILLITTQVVEAGVDIDMDLGFKNQSLIDSDEQLAGRINRNVNKQDCELYLFKINEPSILYGKDKRYEATKKIKNEYAEILKNKDFDRLYQIVLGDIDKWNETPMAVGFKDYLDNIKMLNFENTHKKFQLIEQKNISIFIPLTISTQDFSANELIFLERANIKPNQENKIAGEQVFDLYINLIENKSPDFITQKVNLRTLQGVLSKFVFSVFDDAKGHTRRKLIAFADIEKVKKNEFSQTENDGTTYGFLYLARYHQVYNEEFGLDDSKFDDFENCIL